MARPSTVSDVQVTATDVFWAGYEVARQGKAEAAATVLDRSALGSYALAIDTTHAYFSVGDSSMLLARVLLAGGARQQVAASMTTPVRRSCAAVIEVDDTHAYWTSSLNAGLQRTLKDGSGAVELVVPDLSDSRFAVDARNVYWAKAGGAVKFAPKDGLGTATTLYQGAPMTGSIGRLCRSRWTTRTFTGASAAASGARPGPEVHARRAVAGSPSAYASLGSRGSLRAMAGTVDSIVSALQRRCREQRRPSSSSTDARSRWAANITAEALAGLPAELRARLNLNSLNSSKPPSTDGRA